MHKIYKDFKQEPRFFEAYDLYSHITRNLSYCSRDARKSIAVPVCKLSVYLQPFRCSLFLECALQPKIAKINKKPYFGSSGSFKFQSH